MGPGPFVALPFVRSSFLCILSTGRAPLRLVVRVQDFVKNKPIEIESLNGFIVSTAKTLGMDVPENLRLVADVTALRDARVAASVQ